MPPLELAVLTLYLVTLAAIALFSLHRFWILYLYQRYYKNAPPLPVPPIPQEWPRVTVQLPLYNERYVVERLIDAVARLEYPKNRLEIQVLDDSTDETSAQAAERAIHWNRQGVRVLHIRRSSRRGFKAGALAHGLSSAQGEFIAVFDADFVPPSDFLTQVIPHFEDSGLGLVQTRWGHLNRSCSLLTRLQALYLDGHFVVEQTARNRGGAYFNFNGTAGVWRRRTIEESGGWSDDTLTEDLDLSYRAQMNGWRFLYLPEVVCNAELPPDIRSFQQQQHRWAKGAVQVGRKILPALWRSPASWLVKWEGTFHLCGNFAHLVLLGFAALLFPLLVLRARGSLPGWVAAVEMVVFFVSVGAILYYYAVVQRESGSRQNRFSWHELPALLALGPGMSWNNSRAVLGALFTRDVEFVRTPKFNVTERQGSCTPRGYGSRRGSRGGVELAVAAYFAAAALWGWQRQLSVALPFVLLFFVGFSWVGVLTLSQWIRARNE